MLVIQSPWQRTMVRQLAATGHLDCVGMDATFQVTRYRWGLHALVGPDTFGEAVPLAYCITSSETWEPITKFLDVVKGANPQLSPRVIVIDKSSEPWGGARGWGMEAGGGVGEMGHHRRGGSNGRLGEGRQQRGGAGQGVRWMGGGGVGGGGRGVSAATGRRRTGWGWKSRGSTGAAWPVPGKGKGKEWGTCPYRPPADQCLILRGHARRWNSRDPGLSVLYVSTEPVSSPLLLSRVDTKDRTRAPDGVKAMHPGGSPINRWQL